MVSGAFEGSEDLVSEAALNPKPYSKDRKSIYTLYRCLKPTILLSSLPALSSKTFNHTTSREA